MDAKTRFAFPSLAAVVLLIAALPLAAGCSATETVKEPAYRIYGRLLDKDTGEPIKDFRRNCCVAANWSDNAAWKRETAHPNEDMAYEIIVPSLNKLSVMASSDRYVNTKDIPIDISSMKDGSFKADIYLDVGITKKFRVIEEDTGKPIAGLKAEIEGAARGRYSADTNGWFTVTGIKAGILNVRFRTDKYVDCTTYRFRITRGDEKTIVVMLPRGGEYSGAIENADGKPLSGAKIYLTGHTNTNDVCIRTAASGPDGNFKLSRLPEMNRFKIETSKPGYPARTLEDYGFRLNEKREGLKIVLRRGGGLKVTVIDADKKPVPGAWVYLYIKKTTERKRRGAVSRSITTSSTGVNKQTGKDGRADLTTIEPGDYVVQVRMEGYDTLRNSAEVKPGETAELTFNLPKVDCFSGRVVNRKGEPVPGARVNVSSMPGAKVHYGRGVPADSKGEFRIVGVKPGKAVLEVSGKGYARFRKKDVEVAGVKNYVVTLETCGSVEGKVKGSGPLKNYTIRLYQGDDGSPDDRFRHCKATAGFTGTDGKFKIKNVSGGKYRLVVLAKGYVRTVHPEPVVVKNAAATKGVEVTLAEGGADLEFTVVEEGTGNKLEGASLYIRSRKPLSKHSSESYSDLSSDYRVTGREDGLMWIRKLPPGVYYYTITYNNRTLLNNMIILLKEGEIHKYEIEVKK